MIEKMFFVNLIGQVKNIDHAIEKYISRYNIQLEYATQSQISRKNNLFHGIDQDDVYQELSRKASEFLNQENQDKNHRLVISKESAVKIIQDASASHDQKNKRLLELEAHRDKIIGLLKNIAHFKNFEFDFSSLCNFKFLAYKFGRMPIENYGQYKSFLYDDKNILLIEGEIEKKFAWCLYFTDKNSKLRVDNIFAGLNFEEIELITVEQDFSGDITKISHELENKLFAIGDELDELKNSMRGDKILEQVAAAEKIFELHSWSESKKFGAVISKDFFVFMGWIPEKIYKSLELDANQDDKIMLLVDEQNKNKPPVLLKNNFFFKPFEFLVKLYGIPDYYEIDPTPFLAITYTVLFGLMFGDLGQGFVLFLASVIFSRLHKSNGVIKILSTLGLSSMVFGILYGSIFGFEDLIKPVWIKPADNINFILIFAVVSGIFLIIVSMIFNLINCLRAKQILDFILNSNGLTGLVFYLCVLASIMCVYFKFDIEYLVTSLMIIATLSLFMITFAKPIKKFLHGDKKIFGSNNIFLFLFETLIELAETLLSYFTNTISFVRVGAFALSHAGMMSVVMLLAKTKAGSYNWLIIILGNILVIALEGLIAGIQVLRLEFYEMFGRFFRGTGREFVVHEKK